MRVDIPVRLQPLLEPVSYAAVEEDCTGAVVIVVFADSYKVFADVVLLHGGPHSCMTNPVEGPLEVYEDMVEVLLVLAIFLTNDFEVKIRSVVLLPALKSACSLAVISSALKIGIHEALAMQTMREEGRVLIPCTQCFDLCRFPLSARGI